jgi:D-tyrosyl-tRNA(Tyr) deacylase
MRALLQRVSSASVKVDDRVVGSIGSGLLVFLGVGTGDSEVEADKLADKIVDLRIFPDENHAMNRSLRDVGGSVLVVSQFTLFADCRRGRRPSFDPAERPEKAEAMCRYFVEALAERGFAPEQGEFGAHMHVVLENDGPVTIWLDTDDLSRKR